jgi:hypothetical protein
VFRAAVYRVFDGETPVQLCLERPVAALAALLARQQARGGVLLTAWNPQAQRSPIEANLRAQQDLQDWLHAHAYRWLDAEGAAPDRSWVEPSVLILDLDPSTTAALAGRFDQCAWIELDAEGRANLRYADRFSDNSDPCRSS